MGESKKSGNKPSKTEKLLLATAITQLITALITLLNKLTE